MSDKYIEAAQPQKLFNAVFVFLTLLRAENLCFDLKNS